MSHGINRVDAEERKKIAHVSCHHIKLKSLQNRVNKIIFQRINKILKLVFEIFLRKTYFLIKIRENLSEV